MQGIPDLINRLRKGNGYRHNVLYEILGSNSKGASSANVHSLFQRNKYRLEINKRNTRKRCETIKLTIKILERRH